MVTKITLTVVLMAAATPASAETVQQLVNLNNSPVGSGHNWYGFGYVSGIADVMNGVSFCMPKAAIKSRDLARQAFMNWAASHSESLNDDASRAVIAVQKEAVR